MFSHFQDTKNSEILADTCAWRWILLLWPGAQLSLLSVWSCSLAQSRRCERCSRTSRLAFALPALTGMQSPPTECSTWGWQDSASRGLKWWRYMTCLPVQPPPPAHSMNGAHPHPDHPGWTSKGFPCCIPHFLSYKMLQQECRQKPFSRWRTSFFSLSFFFLCVLRSDLALQLLCDLCYDFCFTT